MDTILTFLEGFPLGLVYGVGLGMVILLCFAAYWFSKFTEAVTETLN